MSDQFAYAAERAGKAWLELLRAERPDLAWEVTVRPRERDDGVSLRPGTRKVGRLVARSDDTNTVAHRASASADPHDAQEAA